MLKIDFSAYENSMISKSGAKSLTICCTFETSTISLQKRKMSDNFMLKRIQTVWIFFLMQLPFASAQQIIAEWNFPNNPDNALVDISNGLNTAATISTQGGTGVMGFTQAGATTYSANCTGWDNGSGLKWWEVTINTSGCVNITLTSKQYSSSTGPRDFRVDYRIGAGPWTFLTNVPAVATNWTAGVLPLTLLPVACENQPAVSFRWIMTSNTAVGGAAVASGGNTRIDDISIAWNSDDYYRSIQNGNWNNIATWESSPDNITWNPAIMPPSQFARTITVRSPHTVTINSNVGLDETIVELGATLSWQSFNLTVYNGTGVDLQVNGTFWDNATNNVTFSPALAASWALGANATYIKSNNGSANNWRDNYNGGIATIPATATWYIRKISGNNPSVSSLAMYYPNLIIENNTGAHWIATGPSSFQGAGTTITVKGFMDVGGGGSSTVEFECTNTNPTAVIITGNLTIRTGNLLRNYGTGFDLYSNLICDGSIIYDATDPRRIIFSGSGAQSISGTGTLNIFNMIMNKPSGDLILNRPIKVDNNLQFNNPGGRIFSSSANLLTIESSATVTTPNNSSFVHGPVRKLGDPAFTFPVGKNNDYQAIAISAGSGGGGGVFWSENFGTGCNAGQLATSYTGPNGAWNITNTGSNDPAANNWFVSAAENGQGAGVCGAACGTNRTLHLGATYPSVDPGAAYYESTPGFCPTFLPCSYTDRRAESPLINCTGRTGITLSFNYMEFGEGSSDNATLWYFDGATWSLLIDLPKTLCCGNVTCTGSIQGLWTAYSITLPASANNNPGIRIGFRWVNNANGAGTDPSFAVDDIQLSTSGTTESFTAEYFYTNPQIVYNNIVNAPLDHISQCEYWTLTRDVGTSNRFVTLTWDLNSCGVTDLPDLRVARFNGASWDDRGNGGTTGTTAAGTIISAAAQTAYGPFTLASVTTENPLPVELLSFNAEYKNKNVLLEWITASELNNDYFSVQRSKDGKSFQDIARVKGAGSSSSLKQYQIIDDNPLPDLSYYRLKQVDFDGSEKLTHPVAVKIPTSGTISIISVMPFSYSGVVSLLVYSEQKCNAEIMLIDAQGRAVVKEKINLNAGMQSVNLTSYSLAEGLYTLLLHAGNELSKARFNY